MWWKFVKAVWRKEHKLAPTTWLTAIFACIYTIVPVDLIPELIFGPIGFVDDLGVWGVFVMLATREKNRWQEKFAADPRIVDIEPEARR